MVGLDLVGPLAAPALDGVGIDCALSEKIVLDAEASRLPLKHLDKLVADGLPFALRLDKAVDAMRHLKTTEWTLRLGDVQGPIGAPRNEPMVRTRSKLPGIITPEVNSDLYVWTPTPSSAESAAECECFLEAMKRSILQRLAVEPRGAARRILRPGPQVLSPEDPLPSRGLP